MTLGKSKITLIIATFLISYNTNIVSQISLCGNENMFPKTKELYFLDLEKNAKAFSDWKSKNKKQTKSELVIPVHVIVHHYPCESYGTGSNITEELILSQLEILNESFALADVDSSEIPDEFSTSTSRIRFCLASFDPSGKVSSGITRYVSYENFLENDSLILSKTLWPRDEYLNLYVSPRMQGVAGYASLPVVDGLPEEYNDAVRITTSSFGKNELNPNSNPSNVYGKGRVAIHEVGHWLGLYHIWGPFPSNGGCDVDDGIADTPLQFRANTACPTHPLPSCENEGDMFMNHMDYTDDTCRKIFSSEQVEFMEFILLNSRSSLLDSTNNSCLGLDHPRIILESKSYLDCFNAEKGILEVSGYGGTPPYSFRIENDEFQTSGRFENLYPGEYILEVKDQFGLTSKRPIVIDAPMPITTDVEIFESSCDSNENLSITLDILGGNMVQKDILFYNETVSYSANLSGYAEDFETGFPLEWIIGANWQYGNSEQLSGGGYNIPPTDSFLAFNDGALGSQSGGSSIYSKPVDVQNIKNFTVSFDAFFINGDFFTDERAAFSVSTDNGNSYKEIIDLLGAQEWKNYKFNFENINSTNLFLKFEYDDGGGWNYGLAVDNVKVYGDKKLYFEDFQQGEYTLQIIDDIGCEYNELIEIYAENAITLENTFLTHPTCSDNGVIQIEANSVNGISTYNLGEETNELGIFENLEPGIYQVTVFDNQGCSYSLEVELLEWSLEIVEKNYFCSSSPNYEYQIEVCTAQKQPVQWSIQNEGEIIFENTELSTCITFDLSDEIGFLESQKSFIIQALDNFDCSASFEFTLNNPIILNTNLNDSNFVCSPNDSFSLVLENLAEFESLDVSNQSGEILSISEDQLYYLFEPGIYFIDGVDSVGCVYNNEFFLFESEPMTIDSIAQLSEIEGAYIEIFLSGGIPPFSFVMGGQVNETGIFNNVTSGEYTVFITDQRSCTVSADILVESVSSNNIQTNEKPIRIFPNPSSDHIIIQGIDEVLLSKIKIYNINGQLVEDYDFLQKEQTLDVSYFPVGVYFIEFTKNDEPLIFKFFKL